MSSQRSSLIAPPPPLSEHPEEKTRRENTPPPSLARGKSLVSQTIDKVGGVIQDVAKTESVQKAIAVGKQALLAVQEKALDGLVRLGLYERLLPLVYRFRLSNFSTAGLDTGLTYVMRLDFANKTKEMKVESKRKGDKHVFEVSKEMRSFEIDQADPLELGATMAVSFWHPGLMRDTLLGEFSVAVTDVMHNGIHQSVTFKNLDRKGVEAENITATFQMQIVEKSNVATTVVTALKLADGSKAARYVTTYFSGTPNAVLADEFIAERKFELSSPLSFEELTNVQSTLNILLHDTDNMDEWWGEVRVPLSKYYLRGAADGAPAEFTEPVFTPVHVGNPTLAGRVSGTIQINGLPVNVQPEMLLVLDNYNGIGSRSARAGGAAAGGAAVAAAAAVAAP